ncbi:MAG: pyridoxal phosphate-dependent aminotransferase [Wenzhouxiangella sp.]|jgi:N-succinyldiaminopimelate aminotransferase|nr:pyridoxal phosphate-dependent aminotransferase [Wenzhouxiangella sp.]
MPRFPDITQPAQAVKGSVYSGLSKRPASGVAPVPLHIGDTWMEPAVGCRMQDLTVDDHPGMHRYSPVPGYPALRDRIAELVGERSGVPVERGQVLVTGGATAGLAAVVGALVSPGEEVLLVAPHWPLIAGSIRAYGARPVDVPMMTGIETAKDAVARLEAHRSERTVAVYWNTPHNPTGRLIPRDWLEAMSAWARKQRLWIFSDEVYEDYVYSGEHVHTRALSPDNTMSVHSFSKAYGMAGNRCGYLVGPDEAIDAVKRIMTNINYSACSASQLAALNALNGAADDWVAEARAAYAGLGRDTAAALNLAAPQGSTFLFPDVSKALAERHPTEGLGGLLGELAEAGVLVAPGPSFGPYPHHVRVCFTSAPPDQIRRGVEILAAALEP